MPVHPVLRWGCALGWTVLLVVVLLQPSSDPIVGPAAPPGPPTLAREILLTTAHIVGFSGLTALWWWALRSYVVEARALLLAVVLALGIGVLTELGQASVPDRSASVFDLVVNSLSALAAGWFIQTRWFRRR